MAPPATFRWLCGLGCDSPEADTDKIRIRSEKNPDSRCGQSTSALAIAGSIPAIGTRGVLKRSALGGPFVLSSMTWSSATPTVSSREAPT